MAHDRQRRVVDNPFGLFVCANHMPTREVCFEAFGINVCSANPLHATTL
jgi:hypothetical protein